jgi:hypothetical protein
MRVLAAFLVAPAICFAQVIEVAGVKFEPQLRAAEGGPVLQLNGAGLRTRFIFNVYAMGLYLPARTSKAAEAISGSGPKRVALRMLRDVDAQTFTGALEDGLRANHSEAQFRALEPRVRQLAAIMAELKEAKEGMRIALDWRTGTGTVVMVDGSARGKPIEGEDFYAALLRVWLGENPVQSDLKKALLGEPG